MLFSPFRANKANESSTIREDSHVIRASSNLPIESNSGVFDQIWATLLTALP
ncbi:hypothetical protein COJE103337_10610 [Corynebacterium jeikeium]|nr:hypothetical protein HMPREF0297_0388 [Corynebacterium jeikeium ATCC 43734]WCZ54256.1 hypothetical protein CJEIK_08805 [Corynebacterium jeikeium]SQI20234.1 Uncharacterised protein [Corynebacterium jeikeium]SUY84885.1 Uncharacterised protein [Corynebacterium jeikeium]